MRQICSGIRLFLLLLMILVVGFPASAVYDRKITENGIDYWVKGNEAFVTKNPNSTYSGDIIIPEYVKGYKVVEIESHAFSFCEDLTSIKLPNSLRTIGHQAFYKTGLESIVIPNSVTFIDSWAFGDNSNLKSITLSENLKKIGYGVFLDCPALTSINIPNSVTSIGEFAFSGCAALTGITLPNSVTSIGKYAFSDCTALTGITLPNSVTSIGESAFSGCTALTGITLPNSVTSIGESAFNHCSALSSLQIPDGVTTIGNYAFSECTNLTSVTIPESVTNLGYACFSGCTLNPLKIMAQSCNRDALLYLKKESLVLCRLSTHYELSRGDNRDVSIHPYDSRFNGIENIKAYITALTFNIKDDNPYYDDTCTEPTLYANISYWSEIKPIGIVAPGDEVKVGGLTPNRWRYITIYMKSGDNTIDVYKGDGVEPAYSYIQSYDNERTQTTLTINSLSATMDESCLTRKLVCSVPGKEVVFNDEPIKFTDLAPRTKCTVKVIYNEGTDFEAVDSKEIYTLDIKVNAESPSAGPTTLASLGSYDLGDATLDKVEWIVNDKVVSTENSLRLTGLVPEKEYPVSFNVTTATSSGVRYTKTYEMKATTDALVLNLGQPQSVAEGKTRVTAETNIADFETNVGFEWKKYDAPEALPYSHANTAIYDGHLEGLLRNLQATYYNVRAFYCDAEGTYHYTDLSLFDPTDFSYFEPTVHTYPAYPSETSVCLEGYALEGSDDILTQGFQYWTVKGDAPASARKRIMAASDDVFTIVAKGQRMAVTLTDLEPGTTYAYRAFVDTASGTTYGEEYTFETPGGSGIGSVSANETEVTVVGYYDLSGRRYDTPQRGFNIILYSDGSTRKVMSR